MTLLDDTDRLSEMFERGSIGRREYVRALVDEFGFDEHEAEISADEVEAYSR